MVAGRPVPGSVSSNTFSDAVRTIAAVARQGEIRKVFLRVGWAADRLYLDLATPAPRALEIGPEGWAIVPDPPVHLLASNSAHPLPLPVAAPREEVLRELARFFGFARKDDRLVLLIGALMAALMPEGPYPVVVFVGEQGSGKTKRSGFIKSAIDPTEANMRGRPRSPEDLAISVSRSWVPTYDNLSSLSQEMSDWICRFSEGGGLPKRRLFTDTDEVLISAARLQVLNGIPDLARSGDLIDRSVLIRCDPLPIKTRERVLSAKFEKFRPKLLHYLVEAASCALRNYDNMADTHEGLRRGDWCAWVEAGHEALGLADGRVHARLPGEPGRRGQAGGRAGRARRGASWNG